MIRIHDERAVAILSQLDVDNQETFTHSKRVLGGCFRFARVLGLSRAETDDLCYGALLHDVGKCFIDLGVLRKPGALSEEDRWLLSTHPGKGAELAARHGFGKAVTDTILSHHERWDGGGYPRRLAGDAIPFSARVVSLVDAYDTIISKRAYDPPRAVAVAVSEIEKNAGAQFDPALAELYLSKLRRKHYKQLSKGA